MGLINNLMDRFKNAEFTVAPQKKLKTISADFKNAFDLTLVFYKGVQIADGELTLAALNKKTTKDVKSTADGLKIKASMKVGDAEKLFDSQFGITVQIIIFTSADQMCFVHTDVDHTGSKTSGNGCEHFIDQFVHLFVSCKQNVCRIHAVSVNRPSYDGIQMSQGLNTGDQLHAHRFGKAVQFL